MAKYDDASWHYGGEFPADLPQEAGATHIGMFLAWALLNGLEGELHTDEFPDDLARLRSRGITPGQFVMTVCDGKFTDEDLNDEGNAFAEAYFGSESGGYFSDYDRVLAKGRLSVYHVPDTWAAFDTLAPVIQARYAAWRGGRPGEVT